MFPLQFGRMDQWLCHFHLVTTDPSDSQGIRPCIYVYIPLFVIASVCQSIRNEASLSPFSATLLISTHLSHFFCLLLEAPHPPPNSLSTMAQPSINVTQKLLLCSVIRACAHVRAFLKHSALCCFRMWPCTSTTNGRFIVMHISACVCVCFPFNNLYTCSSSSSDLFAR